MRALITGAQGTVGKALVAALEKRDCEAIGWDRAAVPIDDYHAMEQHIRETEPDVLFHLAIASKPTGKENESWLVNWDWPSELAWICRRHDIPFVFTSTVMVFSDHQQGPFYKDSHPDATDEYGGLKRQAEDRIFYQNPDARIFRLGWQIGQAPGSNNMIDFFEQKKNEEGKIRASTKWLPACAFLEDTAEVLADALDLDPGLYQLDSNRDWNFHEIAEAISALHGKKWPVEACEDFVFDQRMIDSAVDMPSLKERLPTLR